MHFGKFCSPSLSRSSAWSGHPVSLTFECLTSRSGGSVYSDVGYRWLENGVNEAEEGSLGTRSKFPQGI